MQLPAMLATRAAAWACLIKLVSSSPTLSFPINAQVPPVARIASTFSFVFADNTFTSSAAASSSAAALTYSLVDPPSWLSIDSSERWLHGTPQDSDVPTGDVVGINFGVMATDDTGSTTSNVTLVVSRNPAPTVEIPIAQQLADSGLPYSEPSSVLSYPDTYFNFSFSPLTFSNASLNYYAVSGDNSPIPSWIAFDSNILQFSGTTPPSDSLVEPPQTFNFQLIASDVTGFSAASIGFSIVVGSREITADDPAVVLNATVGKELVYDGLQNGIRIDGQLAGPSNLTAKVLSGSSPPDWLTFDVNTWELSGTPPSSAQNSAFSISFFDALADSVNVTFQVDIDENGTVFRDTLPAMQAQRGSEFSLDLGPYLVQTDGVTVDVQTSPQEDWIQFDNSTFIVSGNVPISEPASSISVSVRATLDSSQATESETFMLQIMSGTSSSNNVTTSTSATAASPTSTTSAAAASTGSSSTPTKTILLAVLIPTLLLACVLGLLALCFCRRRRRERRELEQSLTNKDISDPVPFSFAYNGQDDIVSSMRALDKEYKVNNLNSAKKQIDEEKAKLQTLVEETPVGTAMALSSDDGAWSDHSSHSDAAAIAAMGTGLALTPAAMIGSPGNGVKGDNESDIPNFPAPPSIVIGGPSPSFSSSSALGSTRSNRIVATAAVNGQWPFEESTIISSIHSRHSSHTTSQSDASHPMDDSMHRDALGILGSVASSSLSKKASGSLLTRQTVRTSTPMQLDITVAAAEVNANATGGVANGRVSEHVFASQEAIVHEEGQGSSGTVIVNGGAGSNHADDGRSSMQAVADGTRSTLETNENALEAGGVEGEGMQRKGFLSGFASRIASRFKKGIPARPGIKRFSTTAKGSSYPSPDQASFDTDLGSVTFGNGTTAQPYKPRPVFIGSVNRINEESPQPSPNMWWNRDHNGSRASGAMAGGRGTPANDLARRQQGYNPMNDDDDDDDDDNDDGESLMTGSDAAGDEVIRLDPPRPAFLGPSNVERESSDLSQDIARSLSNRRPTSGSSGMSGISAAMEEVRSLLLLPTGSPASGISRHSRGSDGLYAPSSNSWETLSSSEPNWTSLYEYVLPGQRLAAAATATATDAGSDEPPTPATGAGLPYGAIARPQQPQAVFTGSPGSAAQHQAAARARAAAQAQQVQAQAAGAAPGSPLHEAASPRSYGNMTTPETNLYSTGRGSSHSDNNEDDSDLALSGRGYRHPSSYYGEPYAMTSNDYEYPPPFVAGDGAFHHYDASEDGSGDDGNNSSGGGDAGAGSRPSIGMAMSKYSQPKLTHASLVSTASSGIRAFI
ncbi:polarity establishment/cellular polarization [Sporothrix curviconia]|uniref:Polarity establishment/cellular polarization n=1 Tax=Sporothrix curviconia TaxID=1260050 RepID=A0ABP0B9P4_9PEZI